MFGINQSIHLAFNIFIILSCTLYTFLPNNSIHILLLLLLFSEYKGGLIFCDQKRQDCVFCKYILFCFYETTIQLKHVGGLTVIVKLSIDKVQTK